MSDDTENDGLEQRMTRFLLGDLPEEEARAFETLLAEDPPLSAEVEGLRRALSLLPFSAAVAPPARLRERTLRSWRASRLSMRGWGPAWIGLVAAAASFAAFALFFLLQNRRLTRELEVQREMAALLEQPNVLLSFSLRGTGGAARAFGGAVLDLDAKRAAVVIRGLPPRPERKVYRLWALVGEKKVPCGELEADPQGKVQAQLAIPVNAYSTPVRQLILTLEPVGGPDTPIGPTVMVSS